MSSYPSIYNIGHKALERLFDGPVLIQEKVDGSQFSFYRSAEGELVMNSKGARVYPDAPPDMFKKAVEVCKPLLDTLPVGLVFRGEYLSKPKHNHLGYDRVPRNHIAIFDVMQGVDTEAYLPPSRVKFWADKFGFEMVPTYFDGVWKGSLDELKAFLSFKSFLGGVNIEGVVIKNYTQFGPDKKPLLAKLVSEEFRETQASAWKVENPGAGDFVLQLTAALKSEARWRKAIIHLKEKGLLENHPKDIGKLIAEVQADVLKEEREAIKEELFAYFWKKNIMRGVTAGLPEWYKGVLAATQFEKKEGENK